MGGIANTPQGFQPITDHLWRFYRGRRDVVVIRNLQWRERGELYRVDHLLLFLTDGVVLEGGFLEGGPVPGSRFQLWRGKGGTLPLPELQLQLTELAHRCSQLLTEAGEGLLPTQIGYYLLYRGDPTSPPDWDTLPPGVAPLSHLPEKIWRDDDLIDDDTLFQRLLNGLLLSPEGLVEGARRVVAAAEGGEVVVFR